MAFTLNHLTETQIQTFIKQSKEFAARVSKPDNLTRLFLSFNRIIDALKPSQPVLEAWKETEASASSAAQKPGEEPYINWRNKTEKEIADKKLLERLSKIYEDFKKQTLKEEDVDALQAEINPLVEKAEEIVVSTHLEVWAQAVIAIQKETETYLEQAQKRYDQQKAELAQRNQEYALLEDKSRQLLETSNEAKKQLKKLVQERKEREETLESLNAEIQRLRTEIDKMREDILCLRNENIKLKADNEIHEVTFKAQRDTNGETERLLKESEDRELELRQLKVKLQDELAELKATLAKKQSSTETYATSPQEVQIDPSNDEQLIALTASLHQAQIATQSLEKKCSELEATLSKSLADLTSERAGVAIQLQNHKEHEDALQRELEGLKEALSKKQQECEALKQQAQTELAPRAERAELPTEQQPQQEEPTFFHNLLKNLQSWKANSSITGLAAIAYWNWRPSEFKQIDGLINTLLTFQITNLAHKQQLISELEDLIAKTKTNTQANTRRVAPISQRRLVQLMEFLEKPLTTYKQAITPSTTTAATSIPGVPPALAVVTALPRTPTPPSTPRPNVIGSPVPAGGPSPLAATTAAGAELQPRRMSLTG